MKVGFTGIENVAINLTYIPLQEGFEMIPDIKEGGRI
jgi:hypothetical protein